MAKYQANKSAEQLSEASKARQRRAPQPPIFLSWGGEIYGPATEEEVDRGLRTSWFEEETLYWHEGMESWTPVYEFNQRRQQAKPDCSTHKVDSAPHAPRIPSASEGLTSETASKSPRPSRFHTRWIDRRGRLIFIGIALLAVLLTVGILLLLMRV